MSKVHFSSVDDYLALQPEAARAALDKVRGAIRKAVPDATEIISYNIPAYRLPGGPVLYFAGWKQHFSLYPAPDHVVAELKQELARYQISKGTIRFPLSEPVPVRLIGQIARLRAAWVAEHAKRPRTRASAARTPAK